MEYSTISQWRKYSKYRIRPKYSNGWHLVQSTGTKLKRVGYIHDDRLYAYVDDEGKPFQEIDMKELDVLLELEEVEHD